MSTTTATRRYVINHELYGDRIGFNTIEAAQAGIRSCGPDFEGTEFREAGLSGDIANEDDVIVGTVVDIMEEDLRKLARLTTYDSAGRHFTETCTEDWIDRMVLAELIVVRRPVHEATGIPYGQEHTVEVTEDAVELGESLGWGEERGTS